MTKVGKVTVSMPCELLARVEELRGAGQRSRSEVVVDLLWRGWHAVESEAREERYRRAYALEPDTLDEMTWAESAADELLAPDRPAAEIPPPSTGKRRAAS